MRIEDNITQKIIKKLLKGEDYRIEIITLLDAKFLEYVMEFFKKIVSAKLKGEKISPDWYKQEFLREDLPKESFAIHSGLNMKTISNMYNTAKRDVVIEASNEHYDVLYESIKKLIEDDSNINITLTIKFREVSVDLNVNESLIVINTLAVKRSAIRGGLWSTAGKSVEKPLLETLCRLFEVPPKHYTQNSTHESLREVDFYLYAHDPKENYRCEVKLMGKGNPESADAAFARKSRLFVADKLSDTNKAQLDEWGIEWVELRNENGYKRFFQVLNRLRIPATDFDGDLDSELDEIFSQIYKPSPISDITTYFSKS